MDYKETLGAAGPSSSGENNRVDDSDDDGTNWGRLATESSQATQSGGAKRKRHWPSKGRYGAATKRKKSNTPMKRKTVRKTTGAKKTPAKARKTLGKKKFSFDWKLVESVNFFFHISRVFIAKILIRRLNFSLSPI